MNRAVSHKVLCDIRTVLPAEYEFSRQIKERTRWGIKRVRMALDDLCEGGTAERTNIFYNKSKRDYGYLYRRRKQK